MTNSDNHWRSEAKLSFIVASHWAGMTRFLNSCINQTLGVIVLGRDMVLDKVVPTSGVISEEADSTANSRGNKFMHEG